MYCKTFKDSALLPLMNSKLSTIGPHEAICTIKFAVSAA